MRLRRMALLGVALLPVVAIAPSASAGDGHAKGWQKVHVSFTPSGPDGTLLDATCDPNDPSVCTYSVKLPDFTQSGDLVGSTFEADAYSTSSAGLLVNAYAGTFVGSMKACGTGSFLYAGWTTHRGDGAVFTIVQGSGTGDFVGISGDISEQPNGTLGGTVRCHRR